MSTYRIVKNGLDHIWVEYKSALGFVKLKSENGVPRSFATIEDAERAIYLQIEAIKEEERRIKLMAKEKVIKIIEG